MIYKFLNKINKLQKELFSTQFPKINFWKPFLILHFTFIISLTAEPFTDNNNGTILDKKTGLIWQKCSRGQTNDATCTGSATTHQWADSITYCTGLTLAGRTWRLPTVNELRGIVDYSLATSPSINTSMFPSTVANYYWSSTTNALTATNAWIVNFIAGYVDLSNETNTGYVRCISGP